LTDIIYTPFISFLGLITFARAAAIAQVVFQANFKLAFGNVLWRKVKATGAEWNCFFNNIQ
jgi:hypothetical protein